MQDFADKTFTALQERQRRFTDIIPHYVAADRSLRVLDIGCGTGEQLFDLARCLRNANLIGVDISRPNVQVAESRRRQLSWGERLTFVTADYLDFQVEHPFEVIVSDSTLHLLSAPTGQLFAKIARDLAPGGIVACTMPYACLYNAALASIRRVFRLLRSPLTDKLILVLGRLLHAQQMPAALLRERVHYMYLLPQCYISPGLYQLLEETCGLDLVVEYPVPHLSLAQLKHRLSILRKRA